MIQRTRSTVLKILNGMYTTLHTILRAFIEKTTAEEAFCRLESRLEQSSIPRFPEELRRVFVHLIKALA